MSHGPTWCSRSTFLNGFDKGTARAKERRVSCEGGSQCSFAPQGGEFGSKMECLAGRKYVFSHCKTDDFVFSTEIDQTSACGITLTPKEGHLFRSHSSCYYFESPSECQVTRFDTDLEWQRATIPAQVADFGDVCSAVRSANHWFFLRKTDDSIV